VVDHLGDPLSGVRILEATGCDKQGDIACGVSRKDTGTVGAAAISQVGFPAYAAKNGAAFVGRFVSLSRAWTADPDRCRAAGVPATTRCTTTLLPVLWMVAPA
jgi:SRSO17 transposase